MDQSRAINALAPFLALAKSANSPRAAADLIVQATSAPNTYVFAELLQQPNIRSLSGHEQYDSHLTLLECFAWGTWEAYKSKSSSPTPDRLLNESNPNLPIDTPNLPQLSDAQTLKLRLLSLLSIASEKPTSASRAPNLSYPSLCQRLDLPSPIDLEHLITTATYRNLLTATLNPAAQTVVITSVAPLRDPSPGRVTTLVAELDAWRSRCGVVLLGLEAEIRRVHVEAERRARREAGAERQIKSALDTGDKAQVLGNWRGGAGNPKVGHAKRESVDEDDGADPMDVDPSAPSNGAGMGKRRFGGGGGGGAAGMGNSGSRFSKGGGR